MFHINSLVPELWCSNFDENIRFYTGVLGFSVAQRRGGDKHAYLSLQGSQIMIVFWEQDGTWEPAPFEKPYGRGANFQFLVNNVCDIHDAVTSADLKPFVQIYTKMYWRTDQMDERTEFAVLDPDGYLLRFSQVNSHRPIVQADIDKLGHDT
jgi:catechol 2,3-dioxygenase-like lactoylglutathione lyase family enzyme